MADSLRVAGQGVDALRNLLPTHFNWLLFIPALAMMAAPTPTIKGISTIYWGMGNANSPAFNVAGAIVESLSITPKNAKPVAEIEDNNGGAAVIVLLVDGFDATVSCVYDAAKAWPAEGANCVLNLPMATGNANANTTAYTCLVVSQKPDLKRKTEAKIELALVYRPGVAV